MGAEVVETAKEVFDRAEMIVKVKEPQAAERAMKRIFDEKVRDGSKAEDIVANAPMTEDNLFLVPKVVE